VMGLRVLCVGSGYLGLSKTWILCYLINAVFLNILVIILFSVD
jgi:hypothetical protein